MRKRDKCIEAIRAVAREFDVALASSDALNEALDARSDFLTHRRLNHQDLGQFRNNLEATYIIRIFAEFEAVLREFWHARVRKSNPLMSQLIKSIASRQKARTDWYKNADELREYRNDLVHEKTGKCRQFGFAEASQTISRFLSELPPEW